MGGHYAIKKILIRSEKFVQILILLNLLAFALESVRELHNYLDWFERFEQFSLVFFVIEYLFRCYVAYKYRKLFTYMFSFLGLIDLVAVAPAFLPFTSFDLRFTKSLRLFQLLRAFKLYRYFNHMRTIVEVIKEKGEELFAAMILVLLFLTICSGVTYYFEKEAQPDKFSNFFISLYWGVHTLTTTGYGDIYPITVGGRIMSVVLSIIGLGLIAIPAGILSAGFLDSMDRKKKKRELKKPDNQQSKPDYT